MQISLSPAFRGPSPQQWLHFPKQTVQLFSHNNFFQRKKQLTVAPHRSKRTPATVGGVGGVPRQVPGLSLMTHSLAPDIHDSGNNQVAPQPPGMPAPPLAPQAQSQPEQLCPALEKVNLMYKELQRP